MSGAVLHVNGSILIGPQEVMDELWVVDGKVTFDRPASTDVQTVQGYVVPGLVDAHCHVGLEATGGVPPERAEEHAVADRDAGALLLRDAGSPYDTHWIDDRDDLPRIIRAGRHIARTKRYIRNFAHEIEPEDLVAYVRQEARRGDGWVKLVGDWIDRDRGDLAPCWPREALKAAIDAAHEEGARVTAHCFGEESLGDFAWAGTDCIEHATGLTEDSIDSFARQGIAIVPTLVNIANFPSFADAGEAKFPGYAAHMRDLYDRRYATIGAAHEAGVQVFVGTDAGGQLPHGLVAREVEELTKVGMTNVEALNAATWGAREWLGRDALAEGASADFVVYAEDPRDDVRVLAAPTQIVLRGKAFR
ncbi:amidohydrolase family protein [Calidifontibacter sp. DB0510]|uniref:Amidohydrolase family protein n=1 Tax=Metallococcus carri TaxID=1656884 RepID=A0A967AXT4_9MICO|nr:amidohydrolase family protein [Metallococcus carri]NHN54399.1 amidohydrolase family protein [Metallococcus carri]NOP36762.1 amidohydrolase family protein [Calidifontibacter sp. DB2511S]